MLFFIGISVEAGMMLGDEKLRRIRQIVERELSCSVHDMDHVMRVYRLCLRLAEGEENVDLEVLKAAALLHDIARMREFRDPTGRVDHASLGAEMAEDILREVGYDKGKIGKIKHCIEAHRFRGRVKPRTIEAKILSDADKLDALGAVGIARSFMLAGMLGQRLYLDVPLEEYVRENIAEGKVKDLSRHSPNLEFELKLRRIPERLYTEGARRIAGERLRFMERFFERLRRELEMEA